LKRQIGTIGNPPVNPPVGEALHVGGVVHGPDLNEAAIALRDPQEPRRDHASRPRRLGDLECPIGAASEWPAHVGAIERPPNLIACGARADVAVRGARGLEHSIEEAAEAHAIEGIRPPHHLDTGARDRRIGALELDDQRQLGQARQHVGKARNAEALSTKGRTAIRFEAGAGVDARQLVGGERRDGAAAVGGAREVVVVHDDDFAVLREANVELDTVDAERRRAIEGRDGVLGSEAGAAAMGEYQRSITATTARHPGMFGRRGAFHLRDSIAFMASSLPSTLGTLRRAVDAGQIPRRSVRSEIRDNLIARLRRGGPVFPGIVGFDETVVPQVVNAILSRHNFILLGLRGQAKTRLLRSLTALLDDRIPVVPGSEINDDPLAPLSAYAKARVRDEGDAMPIAWLERDARYVEKLATPDVTIADMVGDIDPIKAARRGLELGDELTMHYGLLPRANRCVFAINELPDLAGRIQVGLFNILQEGDVQIKGYPVRLPLDIMIAFTANPEDYTARGKIITPLKDRIGSEIRTHYPQSRTDAMTITEQEAWQTRAGGLPVQIPGYVREVIEEVAFQARTDPKIDKRSGVSQRLPISCLENVISNAERRAIASNETVVVPRVADVYAAMPSITGKFELEYEGELRGAETVAKDLIRAAVLNVSAGHLRDGDARQVVRWFETGGTLQMSDTTSARDLVARAADVPGLSELAARAGVVDGAPEPLTASALDFTLEALCAQKKISRSDDWRYSSGDTVSVRRQATASRRQQESLDDDDVGYQGPGKKKYYN
jgi:magnesium chelatase subunit I